MVSVHLETVHSANIAAHNSTTIDGRLFILNHVVFADKICLRNEIVSFLFEKIQTR